MDKKIAFIGAGSIAEAILSGIVKSQMVKHENITMTNRKNQERLSYINENYGVHCTTDKEKACQDADIIILAMKPKDLEASLSTVKAYFNENQLIISVLAGIPTESIENNIGLKIPVIRCMPNTSALVASSMTALAKGKYVQDEHIAFAKELFDTIGVTTVVEEDDMHAVTATSGSGPAYVYYMVAAMQEAAVEMGLDTATAKTLVAQTVIGAGEMLQSSDVGADELRKNITSPGGTTEAAIDSLAANNFQEKIKEGMQQAKEKSIELGK